MSHITYGTCHELIDIPVVGSQCALLLLQERSIGACYDKSLARMNLSERDRPPRYLAHESVIFEEELGDTVLGRLQDEAMTRMGTANERDSEHDAVQEFWCHV